MALTKSITFRSGACYRSSRPEVFCKKGVLRNLAKFTGKYLCQCLFFNKVTGLFCEIFKNTFYYRTPPVAAFDAISYTDQTRGACACLRACDHTYQMEKTAKKYFFYRGMSHVIFCYIYRVKS